MKQTALINRLKESYQRAGRLFVVHCDLLYQCDLDCQHCYLDEKGTRNRDTDFWLDVIDQVAGMGALRILFSGGEAFLRPDLLDLVAHARRRGLLVDLYTHGGLIGPEEAARLAELGVTELQISYYSPNPEVHDHITRRPGSHAATLRGIKLLVAHGVPVKAAFWIMGPNLADLDAMRAHCAELGVVLGTNDHLTDAMGGGDYPQEMAISRQQSIELNMERLDPESQCTSGGVGAAWERGAPCGAGRTMLYITPEGQVTPCRTWPQVFGDLARGDRLADIWQGIAPSQRGDAPTLDDVRAFRNRDRQGCSDCDSVSSCSYCPGEAYGEHGDAGQPATTVCHTGHVRATALARKLGTPDPAPPPSPGRRPLFPIVTTAQVEAAAPS